MDPTFPASSLKNQAREALKTQSKKLVNLWYGWQLAHYGGRYSVERMLALEEYTRNTSMDRVLLICVGVPLVVTALMLCQESIPLQDPTTGWQGNYGFWVRAGLVGVGVGNAASIQITFWLDVPSLRLKQILMYCVLMGGSYVANGMLVAALWVFPIPFFMFTLCGTATAVIFVYLRVIVGAQGFRHILSQRHQLRRLSRIGTLQGVLFIVYPAYQVLFTQANHTMYELPVLLVLPVFRIAIKYIFAAAASYKEDVVPVQVVFTVDFFDAFYLVTFIPTLSMTTLVALIVVDLLQTAAELHELDQQTLRLVARLRRVAGVTGGSDKDLLVAIRALCSISGALEKHTFKVRSCIFHQLSDEGRALLDNLDGGEASISSVNLYQHDLRRLTRPASLTANLNSRSNPSSFRKCFRAGAVQPLAPTLTMATPRQEDIPNTPVSTSTAREPSSANTSEILQEALEVLFTAECLVLSEYLEVIVPVVYGLFLLAMVSFPSSQYHAEMIGVTRENVGGMAMKILAYALLEFGSLVVLAVTTKRNCGINVLYQLAFVLETQVLFIQSTLMMWILMILTYRVYHFGADFSFQFEWV